MNEKHKLFCLLGTDVWQAAIPYVPNTSQFISDLSPGLTYQFRVSSNNNISMSEPSPPSQLITIPSEGGKNISIISPSCFLLLSNLL